MSETMTAVPPDAPVMKAWNEYYQSEEYLNSYKWAEFEEHRDGSMWAAFAKGFEAARKERDEEIAGLHGIIQQAHSALDDALGDIGIAHIEDDAELRSEEPVQWAAMTLARALRSGSANPEGTSK